MIVIVLFTWFVVVCLQASLAWSAREAKCEAGYTCVSGAKSQSLLQTKVKHGVVSGIDDQPEEPVIDAETAVMHKSVPVVDVKSNETGMAAGALLEETIGSTKELGPPPAWPHGCPEPKTKIPIDELYEERKCDKDGGMWHENETSISFLKFDFIGDLLGWKSGQHTVVDLGTGCGEFLQHLHGQNPELTIVGVDGVKAHEKYALENFKDSFDAFCTYDIYEFAAALPGNSVDFLVSNGALFFSTYDEKGFCDFVGDVSRVLTSSGAAWIGFQWDESDRPAFLTPAATACVEKANLKAMHIGERSLFPFEVEYGWDTFSYFLVRNGSTILDMIEEE